MNTEFISLNEERNVSLTAYLQPVGTLQLNDGQCLEIIVGNHLQTLDVGHLHAVPGQYAQWQKQQNGYKIIRLHGYKDTV